MIYLPADKMIVKPLIDLPPGALVMLPKAKTEKPTDIKIRFDVIAGEGTKRYLFCPKGLKSTLPNSVGEALNLEKSGYGDIQTAAYYCPNGQGARIECSKELLDTNHFAAWDGEGRGCALLGPKGIRLLTGNGGHRDGETLEIDPFTWLAENYVEGPRIGWASGWRLMFGDRLHPTCIGEFGSTVEVA